MSGDGGVNKGGPAKETTPSSTMDPDQTKPRDPSPLRASRSSSSIPTVSRSRKNSQEFSPTRNTALSGTLSTIPSAAAVQRALSAQRPFLQPAGLDGSTSEASKGDKVVRSTPNNPPSWPTSPRLKSPPPPSSASRHLPQKRIDGDHTPSNTSQKRLSTAAVTDNGTSNNSLDPTKENTASQPPLRPPGRGVSAPSGALETVAEGSVPSTPFLGPIGKALSDTKVETGAPNNIEMSLQPSTTQNGSTSDVKSQPTRVTDENKARTLSTSKPTSTLAKRSLTSLTAAKPKPPDPPRTMTVETEPVVTNPQILGPGLGGRDGSGSVRTKPSNETIRPKKEKKKTRKPTSLHAGTVTSKADIFEAKVASAVDEADTSDSDETFVYESNPPESRSHRHHSRTPSATSLASTEPHGRNRHGLRSGSHAVGAKKSMKFSNSGYNHQFDEGDEGSGRGSVRNPSSHRHHHIGRHGKSAHSSILDSNSPFSQASRNESPRAPGGNLARSSRPNSPRLQNGRMPSSPKKGDAIDMYDNIADDERTPLMGNTSGSVRINRNRHSRRPHGSGLRNTEYYEEGEPSVCSRLGNCLILGVVVLILGVGIMTFVIGLNQPLLDIKVRHLQNILASEQELMLDLHVDAVNTNLFTISVSNLDVNLFAESSYAGNPADDNRTKSLRWGRRVTEETSFPWPFTPGGVDEGTDPIEDPEPGMQKMLLGSILEFDSPLSFDASPLRRRRSSSVGEIRLAKPGNQTEVDGSEKWERVIKHDFNLILRGVIKYQLPLSSKTRSVKVASKATVHPSDDDGSES